MADLAHMTANQGEAAVAGVVAQLEFDTHSWHSYGYIVSCGDPEKPFSMLGYIHHYTLTRAIQAYYLPAVCVHGVRQQYCIKCMLKQMGYTQLAMSSSWYGPRSLTICCNYLPVADKTLVDIGNED